MSDNELRDSGLQVYMRSILLLMVEKGICNEADIKKNFLAAIDVASIPENHKVFLRNNGIKIYFPDFSSSGPTFQ